MTGPRGNKGTKSKRGPHTAASVPIPFQRLAAPARRALKGAGYGTLADLTKAPERQAARMESARTHCEY